MVDGGEFDSRPPGQLGWFTFFGQVNHWYMYFTKPFRPTQPPTYAGREMSRQTGQGVLTLCGWGVKAGMFHSACYGKRVVRDR